jgi:4-amino-4-deoxy-L-arabinose transferase-like glycosyltransferase
VATIAAGTWPLALHFSAPDHLAAWWALQIPPRFWSAIGSDPFALAKNLPWFGWPALPLVLWTLWTRGRGFNGGLAVPGIEIPGTLALVIVVCLTLAPEPRAILATPLLLPLALLAAMEIDTLKRGFSAALDWFGILTFGLFAALVWWIWIDARVQGMSPTIAHLFRDIEVGYRPRVQWGALAVSVFLTALWITLVRPARRSNRRAVLNWAAGMTLIWGLYSTIWLPYLDSRRSYRSVAESLAAQLPATGCVASRNLGEPQRALFRYFLKLSTVREEVSPAHDCDAVLHQYGRIDRLPDVPEGWYAAWEGRRRGDDTERFVLYRKVKP